MYREAETLDSQFLVFGVIGGFLVHMGRQNETYSSTYITWFFLLLIAGVIYFAATYFYLSDCSVDGVRTSKWIDDADFSTGCLSPWARSLGLVGTPILGVIAALKIIKLTRKNK